jgi:hypothetical protein
MKRSTFILILVVFFLMFSYSGGWITGRVITARASDTEFCEGDVLHFAGGTRSCAVHCDSISSPHCCGDVGEPCCSDESGFEKCGGNAECVNGECKKSSDDSKDPSSRQDRTAEECAQYKTKHSCEATDGCASSYKTIVKETEPAEEE